MLDRNHVRDVIDGERSLDGFEHLGTRFERCHVPLEVSHSRRHDRRRPPPAADDNDAIDSSNESSERPKRVTLVSRIVTALFLGFDTRHGDAV